ncbi:right-handed parallel beta-helix repeat-containing protein [Streptomyces sp. Rer75]|uniref:right-handed parallel beta-helix repeat-containing protein n=1 Tax=Streptomyces sp. Rer75 TaxID=2750011 RepID=UPI0015D0C96C|nr:right-handed parallel beta-helix repeat-containing protein [Streptomyces sp. Rer75]QLH26520.1 right-handed parallel beta-helix repeat-containing protein [Streptomyces sp. Rer75]
MTSGRRSVRPGRRPLGLLTAAALGAAATLTALPAPASASAPVSMQATASASGTTYYVDSRSGHDDASGTSVRAAWRSLERVGRTTFRPGDRILLKGGGSWKGQLWPKGSGEQNRPITIGRYGPGPKPRIRGEGQVDDAVRLFNQEYWEIRDLDVSNALPATGTPGENLRDLRGIHVSGDDSRQLDHFVIDRVDVHDVTGEVNWISGDTAGNAPGVRFKTGWDRSKKTGGIVFDTTVPDITAPPAAPTVLHDVRVQNSTVRNTSFAGIVVKQYTGDLKDADGNPVAKPTGWGTRTSAADTTFTPHTNITIRNNHVSQGGTAYGCNAMYLTNVRGAVVDRNVVDQAGTSGIEAYYADDVVIQRNEVYRTERKAGGADSNGIDADKGTTRVVIQYNFVHDNGDGILLCQFAFGDVVVRYNVLNGNSRYPLYLHSDKAASAEVYNNTVHNTSSKYLVYGYGSSLNARYNLHDNVFSSAVADATLTTSPTITYARNFYGGAPLPVPATDTQARTGDPLFVNPAVSGPYGTPTTGPQLRTGLAFAPRPGSPLIDTGAPTPDNGGRDYRGTPLYRGAPDVGAIEGPR